jgi:hypothetical protein
LVVLSVVVDAALMLLTKIVVVPASDSFAGVVLSVATALVSTVSSFGLTRTSYCHVSKLPDLKLDSATSCVF